MSYWIESRLESRHRLGTCDPGPQKKDQGATGGAQYDALIVGGGYGGLPVELLSSLETAILGGQECTKVKRPGSLPDYDDNHPSARWNPEKKIGAGTLAGRGCRSLDSEHQPRATAEVAAKSIRRLKRDSSKASKRVQWPLHLSHPERSGNSFFFANRGCDRMMIFLDPLDEFEASVPLGIANPDKLIHLGFAEALEFSALRFLWWKSNREDLLDRFPELDAWTALRNLRALAGHTELLQPGSGRQTIFSKGETRVLVQPFSSSVKDWGPNGMFANFRDRFRATLRDYGMSEKFASALAGALHEMASNAVEHSKAPVQPVACFEVGKSTWAFGVVDVGRGTLASLRENPRFSGLQSETEALTLAVQPGVSRYQDPGRGNGFSSVFKALVDRRARLRFRSGGASALWEGKSPTDQNINARALPFSRPGFQIRVDGPMS